MMKKFEWITSTIRINWINMTADSKAFWSLGALMAVQNLIYFSLWAVVFSRVSSLKGWGLPEVAFLYGSGAIGYGILFSVLGGLNQLSSYIQDGLLDVYLARPRPVLLSILMHRMRADSLGDILAGVVMLLVFVRPEWKDVPLIMALSILAGIVYAAFRLIVHTLAFWGTGNETSENGFSAFLIASTNPQNGFGPWGKFVLLTVFPAGYISLLPVEILKKFDWKLFTLQICGSFAVLAFSLWLFQQGLKRYASGNRFLTLR
jgi:ABC-2 type transport system permease protein